MINMDFIVLFDLCFYSKYILQGTYLVVMASKVSYHGYLNILLYPAFFASQILRVINLTWKRC